MIDSCLNKLTVCPYCHSLLEEDNNKLICSGCNRIYLIRRGIPDFREKDEYWCNVSRERMEYLNRRAEETGNWLNSAIEIIPEYASHFTHFCRADSQFLWPTNKDSIILDAGSMWGGLTIPAAQFHREVYAVDKTIETLEFLKIRAEQMGLENIRTFAASIKSLPFLDNYFDLVILNGVLEWVGLDEDTILEKHWEGTRDGMQAYSQTPEEMQMDVLKEISRVLKPNGCLYIAIENRYGIQYFLSYPDNHNNVRFTTILPRFLSNLISKIKGKGEYRTYTYSPGQLANLLQKSGFNSSSMYGLFPHYIKIKKAFPLNMARLYKNEVQIDGIIPRILHIIVRPLIPKFIAKHVSPSLFAICRKNNNKNELIPRIHKILVEENIINKNDRVHFVISNNRYENFNSTNIIIHDHNNSPLYFCKIARDLKKSGLQSEANNIKWTANKLFASKGLSIQIPKLLYSGVVNGIMIFVTTYLNAKNINLAQHYTMNNGLDKIGITNKFIRENIGFAEEKLFLKKIDGKIRHAISALVELQQATSNGKLNIKDIANNTLNKYLKKHQGSLPDEIKKYFIILEDKIRYLPEIDVLACLVHGDYNFNNVLFFSDETVGLVDFEHIEKEGSPFFDLTTLIFDPLITKWQSSYLRNESFIDYLNKYGAMEYIVKWLKCFCNKQHIPDSIIQLIPLIAAIEQNTKVYPLFRDPHTYLMYGENMLKEILSININEKY